MKPHTERYTFRPGQVPSDPVAYRRSQEIEQIASAAQDLFTRSDNTTADHDGHEGIVLLRKTVAPGLLEPVTTVVTGRLDRAGQLRVMGENRPGQPPTALTVTRDGIFLDRPAYVNHHLLPCVEGLRIEPDGTRHLSLEFYDLGRRKRLL